MGGFGRVFQHSMSDGTRVAVKQEKQVDILISKNQALQILYLKHSVYKTT